MADGNAGSVGSVYLDLVVRDTVEKQVQAMAVKAQTTAKQSFTGMEDAISASVEKAMAKASKSAEAAAACASQAAAKAASAAQQAVQAAAASATSAGKQAENAINRAFSKPVAMAEARLHQLERAFDDVGSKLDVQWQSGTFNPDNKATKVLLAQQEKLYAQIEAARERLAIEVQAAAAKQAAAEEAAAQRATRAAEVLAAKQAAAAKQGTAPTPPPAVSSAPAAEVESQVSVWQRLTGMAGAFGAKAGKVFSTVGKLARGVSRAVGGIAKRFTSVNKSTGSFGTRLKGIVSGALIFNGISAALRNVTSYFGSAISSATEMKQAMANLKGAAATAAAPIIEVLTPALTALANAAATVFSYLSRLISYFTGKSLSSMAKAARGMKNAASTAKKAMASLAGFDEIERLGGDSGSSGDGSSSGFNYDFQGQSGFLDSILESVKVGQWGQIGALIAQKINDSVAAIPWPDIQGKAVSWVQGAVDVFNSFVDKLDYARIGHSIGEGINTVADMTGTFFRGIDWAGLGSGVGTGLFTAFRTIDWVQICEDLSAGITGVFSFATSAVRAIDWNYVGNIVSECLLSIDWFGILKGLFGFVFSCAEGFTGLLGGVFQKLADACGEGFFGNLFQFFADISTWIRDKIAKPLVDAFTDVDASLTSIWEDGIVPAIKGAVNGIIQVVNGLISGVTSGINTVIRALNKLKFTIPSWVPALGGKSFGFNLSTITAPKIPMLADGGVITQPTLAMMGEYTGARSNPEIAAPQSLIEETVARVMQDYSDVIVQGFEATVAVLREILEAVLGIELDGEILSRAVDNYKRKMAVVEGRT